MIQALPLPLLPQLPQLAHPPQQQIPSKMARIQIKKKKLTHGILAHQNDRICDFRSFQDMIAILTSTGADGIWLKKLTNSNSLVTVGEKLLTATAVRQKKSWVYPSNKFLYKSYFQHWLGQVLILKGRLPGFLPWPATKAILPLLTQHQSEDHIFKALLRLFSIDYTASLLPFHK